MTNPKPPDRPSRAYWVCQAIGWGLYVATTVYQTRHAGLPITRALVEPLLAATLGIGLTHEFRRQVRRRRWVQLPIATMAPRVIGAAVLLAVMLVSVLAFVELGIYRDRPASATLMVVFAVMRWTLVFLVWTAFYMGHALVTQRQATELRQLQLERALQTAERIYWNKEQPLYARSLVALEEHLDPQRFFRANRAQIVNLEFVKEVEVGLGGRLHVQLRSGPEVEISRRPARLFRERTKL